MSADRSNDQDKPEDNKPVQNRPEQNRPLPIENDVSQVKNTLEDVLIITSDLETDLETDFEEVPSLSNTAEFAPQLEEGSEADALDTWQLGTVVEPTAPNPRSPFQVASSNLQAGMNPVDSAKNIIQVDVDGPLETHALGDSSPIPSELDLTHWDTEEVLIDREEGEALEPVIPEPVIPEPVIPAESVDSKEVIVPEVIVPEVIVPEVTQEIPREVIIPEISSEVIAPKVIVPKVIAPESIESKTSDILVVTAPVAEPVPIPLEPSLPSSTPNWAEPLEEEVYSSTTGEIVLKVGEVVQWDTVSFEILAALPRGWYHARQRSSVGDPLESGSFEVALKPNTGEKPLQLSPHRLSPAAVYSGSQGVALPWLEGGIVVSGVLPFEKGQQAVLQLAQYVFALEKQGYALLDLEPSGILETPQGLKLRFPPRLVQIGENLPALDREGYSPPELRTGGKATGKEGVYFLAALLLNWLTGENPSSLSIQSLPIQPGLPQLIFKTLCSAEQRYRPADFLAALRKLNPPPEPYLELGCATTVGLNPERPVNEDSYGYRLEQFARAETPLKVWRAVVCDGMGGMASGEVASGVAVERFLSLPYTPGQGNARVEALVWEANNAVLEALSGVEGGCTFTGAILEGPRYFLGHVGDSRAYLGDTAGLHPISQDHSLVAAMVANGLLTEEEAEVSPDKNKILRSLGSIRHFQKEYVQLLEGELQAGQALILVSDGVWGEVSKAKLLELWNAHHESPQRLADQMVFAALESGAMDNATAVVVRRK